LIGVPREQQRGHEAVREQNDACEVDVRREHSLSPR
jgi:hypothetical protein